MIGSLTAADFNDALGEAGKRGPTSFGQQHPIDWIFVRNLTPLRGRVVEARQASDHFPVFAAFQGLASVALAPVK
jgi:endonuclease/exonuclease/phosphatase (EEP) superfamily protein YafD